MNHYTSSSGKLTLALAVVVASGPAAPQRRDDGEERTCINLRQVERTRVANEDTILFYMRGGGVYRNDLSTSCPDIEREERFMYRTTLGQLCNTDVITVLDDVGFGFMQGASCGLGKFRPISEEEADALRERRR
jgi:hypothetical protein